VGVTDPRRTPTLDTQDHDGTRSAHARRMDRSKRALSLAARTEGQVMVEYLAIVGLLVIAGLASWAWWRGAIRSVIRGEAVAAPTSSAPAGSRAQTRAAPRR
jgi:hypothetical protein